MSEEFTIIIQPGETSGFVAFIPEVPGAFSQGSTVEEAREMVLDALHELNLARRELAIKRQVSGSVVESYSLVAV